MTTLTFEERVPKSLMEADDLPSLPAVALEVLRLTQAEDSTIEELADCLSRDPALAAKILKLSNSSMFSTGQEITSIQRATMMLGLKTVKVIVPQLLPGRLPAQVRERAWASTSAPTGSASVSRSVAARSRWWR